MARVLLFAATLLAAASLAAALEEAQEQLKGLGLGGGNLNTLSVNNQVGSPLLFNTQGVLGKTGYVQEQAKKDAMRKAQLEAAEAKAKEDKLRADVKAKADAAKATTTAGTEREQKADAALTLAEKKKKEDEEKARLAAEQKKIAGDAAAAKKAADAKATTTGTNSNVELKGATIDLAALDKKDKTGPMIEGVFKDMAVKPVLKNVEVDRTEVVLVGTELVPTSSQPPKMEYHVVSDWRFSACKQGGCKAVDEECRFFVWFHPENEGDRHSWYPYARCAKKIGRIDGDYCFHNSDCQSRHCDTAMTYIEEKFAAQERYPGKLWVRGVCGGTSDKQRAKNNKEEKTILHDAEKAAKALEPKKSGPQYSQSLDAQIRAREQERANYEQNDDADAQQQSMADEQLDQLIESMF